MPGQKLIRQLAREVSDTQTDALLLIKPNQTKENASILGLISMPSISVLSEREAAERCQADKSAVSDGGEDQGAEEAFLWGQERIVFRPFWKPSPVRAALLSARRYTRLGLGHRVSALVSLGIFSASESGSREKRTHGGDECWRSSGQTRGGDVTCRRSALCAMHATGSSEESPFRQTGTHRVGAPHAAG